MGGRVSDEGPGPRVVAEGVYVRIEPENVFIENAVSFSMKPGSPFHAENQIGVIPPPFDGV